MLCIHLLTALYSLLLVTCSLLCEGFSVKERFALLDHSRLINPAGCRTTSDKSGVREGSIRSTFFAVLLPSFTARRRLPPGNT